MLVHWRDDEYDFRVNKLEGKADKWNRNSDADKPIFGCDTESVETPTGYEPQCFTFSSVERGKRYQEIPSGSVALWDVLQYVIDALGESLHIEGCGFIYFHNLEYDWLQLVKFHPALLEMARIGVSPEKDVIIGRVGGYSVIMKKSGLFKGSAPHFTIRLEYQQNKKRYGFELKFRDTFSYFPGSLDSVSKNLKLPEKMERQEDLGRRDFRRESMSEDKQYFMDYAMIDADNTRLIAEQIRDLHTHANMTKIRPSSPGYAINRLLHMMGPDRQIVSGVEDNEIMQLIFDTYRGGRTGGIYHGKVDGIRVYDFHSSYPASMCSLPSFSPSMGYVKVDDLSLENVMAVLAFTGNAFLRVSGTETNASYPSLITQHNGKLTPIFGDFENVATTGYEFYLGVKSGGLENVHVHEMVVLLDMEENPFLPFKHFAEESYKEKASTAKGTITYLAAKLKLNSAYGKLIESRHNTMMGAADGLLYLPYFEGMEKQFGQYYYDKLIEAHEMESTLDEDYGELMAELQGNFTPELIEGMKYKMLQDFPLTGMIYGKYVVPAAASLITAISRTRLAAAAMCLGALYWDTDSVFVQAHGGDDIANRLLQLSDAWMAGGCQLIRIGDNLGDLDCEIFDATGVLAGVKRYYLEGVDDKGNPVTKQATHGLPALAYQKAKEILNDLATGSDSQYKSKPRPLKAKEAKTPEDIGSFRDTIYNPLFHLDDRIHWTKDEDGWRGSLKRLDEMKVKQHDPHFIQLVMEALE